MTVTSQAAHPQEPAGDIDLGGALALLAGASSVTVLSHVHPDADTIGSALALALVLDRRGIPVQVSFGYPEVLPESMRTLPGVEFLVPPDEVAVDVDLLVTVDCGSRGRLGRLGDRLDTAGASLVIDHHRSNTRYGRHNLIDDAAESTTAVLARLFDLWAVEIDRDIAHCLFAGLVTDTGSFRWVQPGTHALAERLIDTGIDSAAITRRLLDTHPFAWLPMLSTVLGSAQLVPDAVGGSGLVYALVRFDDTAGLGPEEIESVIDIVRTTAQAEVAAVFKENSPGLWSVSLRSKSEVDVSEVAGRLGGGGHRFASGYTAEGDADAVVAELLGTVG